MSKMKKAGVLKELTYNIKIKNIQTPQNTLFAVITLKMKQYCFTTE